MMINKNTILSDLCSKYTWVYNPELDSYYFHIRGYNLSTRNAYWYGKLDTYGAIKYFDYFNINMVFFVIGSSELYYNNLNK